MPELLHVHGSRNRFYLLDQTQLSQPLTPAELVRLGQTVSRHTEDWPGADGLLVVDAPTHEGPLGKMTVINADGSIASMCGNGLRTVGRYLAERDGQKQFTVETAERDLHVSQEPDLAPGVPAFSVEISPVSFDQDALPFAQFNLANIIDAALPPLHESLRFTAIAVPNPHLISFVEDEADLNETLGTLGQRLNAPNPYFPDGVNVNFAKILGPNTLFVRTFERGVGFTNACGTGMSATSYAFSLLHPELVAIDKAITVYNPGGMVKTKVHPDSHQPWIELIGNATFLEKVKISEEDLHSADLDLLHLVCLPTGEEAAYERFVEPVRREQPTF